jgi:hypothetical protein
MFIQKHIKDYKKCAAIVPHKKWNKKRRNREPAIPLSLLETQSSFIKINMVTTCSNL